MSKYNIDKVDFFQSRKLGRVTIIKKGNEEETGEFLKKITNALLNE